MRREKFWAALAAVGVVLVHGLLATVGVAYAVSLTKSIASDFNAGTYSNTAHQTIAARTGVQLNVQSGPDGTRFRLPITIDNTASSSARTNYVVAVPFDTATRIQNGLMQADCGDIRFRDSDDSTAITEFEIKNCNTSGSYALLEVPSIPALDTTDVYLYFGSPTTLASQSTPQTIGGGEIYEDMQSAPSGQLKGVSAATYDSVEKYVQLTNIDTYEYGALEYNFNPGENFDATFDLWAGGGTGADATYLYVYADSTPETEYENVGGYVLQVNELQEFVSVNYEGQNVAYAEIDPDDNDGILDGASIDDSAWHPIRMTKTGDRFRVYFDNVLLIDHEDTAVRDLSGPLTGVGARNGGLTNYHRIRNLRISQTVVSSDEESLRTGTWSSPEDSTAYEMSGIENWGDGTNGSSTAFSANIASASALATIQFHARTAPSTGALAGESYISLGTANTGTTFTKTKQELDDAGLLPQNFMQVRATFTRTLTFSPVLQSFTITHDGPEAVVVTPQQSPQSSQSQPTSNPSAPSCGDKPPFGSSDLFQITRDGSNATLYFTPTNDHVQKYHVTFGYFMGDERFGTIGADVTSDSNTGVQSIMIGSLDPKTAYWFKVVPVNGCAVGEWSNWLEAKRTGVGKSLFFRWF